jgi:hypothetical protein
MGSTQAHALGFARKVYVAPESTYGTFIVPSAKHALKATKCDFDSKKERKQRVDYRGYRDLWERFTGRTSTSWSLESYVMTSGAAGIAPDTSALIRATMGACTCTQTITISTITGISGKTVTVTIDGSATVLTEGSSWTTGSTTSTCATALAAAIAALDGVGATATDNVITVTYDANYYRVALVTNAASIFVIAAGDATFALSTTQGTQGSLSITQSVSSIVQEAVWGALVESMTIKGSGGSEPTIAFSGQAAGLACTGTATHDGALSGSETALTIHSAETGALDVNSVIQLGTSTNHQVTAVSGTAVTVSPGISGAQDKDAAIVPYVPTYTTYGVPLSGTVGAVVWAPSGLNTTLPVTDIEVTVKTGVKPIADQFGAATIVDYIEGAMSITGTMTLRGRKDLIWFFKQINEFNSVALRVDLGTYGTAGIRISMPYVELDASKLEIPDSDEVTFKLPFTAKGSAGGDAISIAVDLA